MSEHSLWEFLKSVLPNGHYSRIESPDTAPGHPDVTYQIARASGVIELKDAQYPNRIPPFKGIEDGLHLSQLGWIKQNLVFGGRVWIVARVGIRIYWIPGENAPRFNGCERLERLSSWVLTGTKLTNVDVQVIRKMLEGTYTNGNDD